MIASTCSLNKWSQHAFYGLCCSMSMYYYYMEYMVLWVHEGVRQSSGTCK